MNIIAIIATVNLKFLAGLILGTFITNWLIGFFILKLSPAMSFLAGVLTGVLAGVIFYLINL